MMNLRESMSGRCRRSRRLAHRTNPSGRLAAVTNALGVATVYEYDLRGNKVYEGGGTYPVRYTYNVFGNKTTMMTYRREGRGNGEEGSVGDTTTWLRDEATGLVTNKVYADGKGPKYTYTPDGKLATRTWARGIDRSFLYDESRRLSSVRYFSDDTSNVSFIRHRSGFSEISVVSNLCTTVSLRDRFFCTTNEVLDVQGELYQIHRNYDFNGRDLDCTICDNDGTILSSKKRDYDSLGRLRSYKMINLESSEISVAYEYDDKSNLSVMRYILPNGAVIKLEVDREEHRSWLITNQVWWCDSQKVFGCAIKYDQLGRPVNASDSVLNARKWMYNRRNELASAIIGTNNYSYAYDLIGNREWVAVNTVTNSYSANSLNQYMQVDSSSLIHDEDGNLIRDDCYNYSYDAENRLIRIMPIMPSNGCHAIRNCYDHNGRRIKKIVERYEDGDWCVASVHTFAWDGNNIVLERITSPNESCITKEYFWGIDKSGSEQGAGGIGGLLAVSVNGVFSIPCYDHNGNIVAYISENGGIESLYVYDAYGNIIDQSGEKAKEEAFGFSTKYHDREVGLIGYQKRFYRPDYGRWLNRDPIEEEGGENLYAFCGNNPILYYDINGESFWGYFVDTAKTLSGAFTAVAGFTLGATVGWTGIGAVGAAGLIAIGADQFASGVRNLVNRAQGRSVSNNTYVQVAYKYATKRITGRSGSGLERTLDAMYFSAEVVSACATGIMSIGGSIAVVRSIGPARTATRWVSVNGYARMEFYMTASVSTVEAGGVVATETFSTTLSGISFFSSPRNDMETVDMEIENYGN